MKILLWMMAASLLTGCGARQTISEAVPEGNPETAAVGEPLPTVAPPESEETGETEETGEGEPEPETAPPELLPICVESRFQMELLSEGHGALRYPVYVLGDTGPDMLSAALAELNEARLDGVSGEIDYFHSVDRGELYHRTEAFVTRSDSVALSFYERTERYESPLWENPITGYRAHNLESATGRELGFSDVFQDPESLPELLAAEFAKAYPAQRFYDKAPDFIRLSVRSGDGNIAFSLGYECVHIFADEYILNGEPGGQHITLPYSRYPGLVRTSYQTAPARTLTPLDYDVDYWAQQGDWSFRLGWTMEPEAAEGRWTVEIQGGGAQPWEETFYGYAPDCALARYDGRLFLYLREPAGDVSLHTDIYELTETGVLRLGRNTLALRDGTPLDPDRMLMNVDSPIFTASVRMQAYGVFRAGSGLPEPVDDLYSLEGPWVALRESGRYNPDSRENAAVSGGMWTLTAGTRLRPYQTDGLSFVDFITEDGRVVRFAIDRYGETMRLDNFGTLDDVFEPAEQVQAAG